MDARNRWFTEELLPKLMVRFWIGISTTVVALSGVFMYMSHNVVRDFELRATALYESQGTHDKDVDEIKGEMRRLSADVTHSLNAVLDRLDRNYSELKSIKR